MNALPPDATRPAGFWICAFAAVVDLAVILAVQATLAFVGRRLWGSSAGDAAGFRAAVGLFTILFAAVYATVLHATEGQTVGKALVGVRVLGVNGERLPAGAALLRWLAGFVALAPVGLGFIMVGLRTDKRGLHDLVAGSQVLRTVPRRRWRAVEAA